LPALPQTREKPRAPTRQANPIAALAPIASARETANLVRIAKIRQRNDLGKQSEVERRTNKPRDERSESRGYPGARQKPIGFWESPGLAAGFACAHAAGRRCWV